MRTDMCIDIDNFVGNTQLDTCNEALLSVRHAGMHTHTCTHACMHVHTYTHACTHARARRLAKLTSSRTHRSCSWHGAECGGDLNEENYEGLGIDNHKHF